MPMAAAGTQKECNRWIPFQGHLDAYNRHDLETFLSYYAPDVVTEDGAGQVMMQGHDTMRQLYSTLFTQSPDLRAEVRDTHPRWQLRHF